MNHNVGDKVLSYSRNWKNADVNIIDAIDRNREWGPISIGRGFGVEPSDLQPYTLEGCKRIMRDQIDSCVQIQRGDLILLWDKSEETLVERICRREDSMPGRHAVIVVLKKYYDIMPSFGVIESLSEATKVATGISSKITFEDIYSYVERCARQTPYEAIGVTVILTNCRGNYKEDRLRIFECVHGVLRSGTMDPSDSFLYTEYGGKVPSFKEGERDVNEQELMRFEKFWNLYDKEAIIDAASDESVNILQRMNPHRELTIKEMMDEYAICGVNFRSYWKVFEAISFQAARNIANVIKMMEVDLSNLFQNKLMIDVEKSRMISFFKDERGLVVTDLDHPFSNQEWE
jgi:hypothetical protein